MRKADLGQAYAGALSRGGLQVLARPGAKGVNPPTLRRHGNRTVFPRVRTGDSTLPFAIRLMALEIVSELSLLRDPSHQTISERTDFLCPGRDGIESLDVLAGMHV